MRQKFTRFFLLLLSCTTPMLVRAQLPVCTSPTAGFIYFLNGNSIAQYDPFAPLSATNPSANTLPAPPSPGGLAVSTNINGGPTSPTFYTTSGGTFWWYNGTTNTWVNTGHSTGNAGAVNIGAGGGFIYNLVGFSGDVYKYDGTGPATLLTTVTGFNGGGPFDLVADCQGNWYILNTTTPNQYLRKYSPTGVLLQSWTLTGAPNTSAGGGMGIIGNTLVYYHNGANPLIQGTIGTTTVTLNPGQTITNAFSSASDYASCPIGGLSSVFASIDTGYYCGTGPGIPVFASGPPNFVWTVVSGNAVVTGSGANVTITATSGTSRIALSTTDSTNSCGGTAGDTVTIIVPSGLAEAGPDDTVQGCAAYTTTLNGIFTNGTPGVTYNYAWTPIGTITAGATSLTPTVAPTAQTRYFLNVFTTPAQGSCLFRDSVLISVQDISVDAQYTYNVRYGCSQDTVDFTNVSTQATPGFTGFRYRWDFGDGSAPDTAKNPRHVFTTQGLFSVKLVVRNDSCSDSLVQVVDLQHPLDASFTQSADSFCQGGTVAFTNTSVTTIRNGIAPKYFWSFGDGGTDTAANPTHTYTRAGVWPVVLSVRDFVPCQDTARDTVVIDSIPFVRIALTDSTLCEGQAVTFTGDFLQLNNTGYTWNFGDGTPEISNRNPVTHGYEDPGTYAVTLTAAYRICADTVTTREVTIRPFTAINLGPDTTICPGGEPVLLTARIGASDGTVVRWSTGDTAASILVRHQGTYWAVADRAGCTSADSVYIAKDCYLDVPNVFSPNGDGANDYFLPRQLLSEGVTTFRMLIYNRWGQKIWETTRIDGRGWDGKFNGDDQPTGVYIYLIEAEFKNGTRERYQGNVTLLR